MPETRQPEVQLTDAEIDEAFHRTMTRSNELTQRRSRRVAAVSGVAVVALLLGGYGILKSLDDGGEAVVVRQGSDVAAAAGDIDPTVAPTTEAVVAAPPPVPEGFQLTISGSTYELLNTSPSPSTVSPESPDGVAIGSGVTEVRVADIVGSEVVGDGIVRVDFACVRNAADRIDAVRYTLVANVVNVQGNITGGYPGLDCTGGIGASIELPINDVVLDPATTAVANQIP